MTFARKIYKIPEFYMIFARKMPEFYIIIAPKIFFPYFRMARAPCPPFPTPMAACYISETILIHILGDCIKADSEHSAGGGGR